MTFIWFPVGNPVLLDLFCCLVSVVLNSPCNGLLCHHESRKRPERQPLSPVLYSSALTARKLTRRGKSPGVPTSPRGGHGLYSGRRRACFKPRTSFILTHSHALLLNNYSQSWATFWVTAVTLPPGNSQFTPQKGGHFTVILRLSA